MKKQIKTLIGLLIAFIIGISTTVGATTIFNSKDITYSSDKTDKTNVKEALDELYIKVENSGKCKEGKICLEFENKISNVAIGSYVSMTPTSTSYTISKDLTGYTSDQTINPSELNLWRVIRKNGDGTVDMVSEYVSSTKVYFYGKEGYMNFVRGLNTIAAQYTNSKYVTKTHHIGYSDQTQTITDTSAIIKNTPPWIYDTRYDRLKTTFPSTKPYLNGVAESKGGGDVGYIFDIESIKTALGSAAGKNLDGSNCDSYVASRFYNYVDSKYFEYCLSVVSGDSVVYGSDCIYRYSSGFYSSYAARSVRPIVTLKSSTEISSGNGTESSPYQLT